MDNQAEFLRQLREVFCVEAEEHLAALQDGILELEKKGQEKYPAAIQRVYRAAHSLKGAARAVDYTEVEAVCHSIESIFSLVQKDELALVSSIYDSLNKSLDFLGRILHGVTTDAQEYRDILASLDVRPVTKDTKPKPTSGIPQFAPPINKIIETNQGSLPEIPSENRASSAPTLRIRTDKLEKILSDAEELIPLKLAFAQNLAELTQLRLSLERAAATGGEKIQGAVLSGAKEAGRLARKAEEDSRRFGALADSILHNSHKAMILPCSHITNGLPKVVRDLSRELGKDVDFIIEDDGLEFEKSILENLKTPLIHLVRNSVDHGIEMPDQRIAKGKNPKGTIRLSIRTLSGGVAEFVLKDDGQGIDLTKVKKAAADSGSMTQEEAAKADDAAVMTSIFLPGVSTSPIVTGISGRGMGLAIVRESVESMGGRVSVDSKPGIGTTFRITAPSARITFDGIVVLASDRRLILPATAIVKAARVSQDTVIKTRGAEAIALDGAVYSLIHLGDALGLPRSINPDTPQTFSAVILESSGKRIALVVDKIMEEQEVLVKPLGKLLPRVKGILGVAVLGSGEILPVLYPKDIVYKLSLSHHSPAQQTTAKDTVKKSILVVEDSITSRMLLKSILESAGYEVAVANDGVEGITSLKTGAFNLVVSDVEMPRMDGFALTAKIRSEPGMERMPVILVTSLESREHREKGVAAGANAYISKSDFAQSNLLETVARFI